MQCEECYHPIVREASFCSQCGTVQLREDEVVHEISPIHLSRIANKITGSHSPVEIKLTQVFSRVLVKHSEEEGERLFLVGTRETTPSLEVVLDSWPRPWLFARIFLLIGFLFLGLFIGFEFFENAHFFPGLIMVGSFIVPITILIFFWEMNAPQNISIYKMIKILFIGGVLSLVTAVFFYKNIGDNTGVIMIGIVEEVAKLLVILWFIRNSRYKYILNGVLIGAAVGTGFATFESAGYAFMAVIFNDFETMYFTIFWRGVLAPGGHIVWAALSGAALCMVKGSRPISFSMLTDIRFLRIFITVIVMHAVWDLPWPSVWGIPIAQICLTVFSWIIAFSIMNLGLREITHLKEIQVQACKSDSEIAEIGSTVD